MTKSKAKIVRLPAITKVSILTRWINSNRVKKNDLRKYPAKLVLFDLSNLKYLKPYHITPLACLIHEYKHKGYRIIFRKVPAKVIDYFDACNFNQFTKSEKNDAGFPIPESKYILPIWRIQEGSHNIYPNHAQQYYESHHFEGKDLFALSNSLGELLNNVFDHSESKIPGFTFTQFNETEKKIITAVCDFGIGIPKKVNGYLKNSGFGTLTPPEALLKALEIRFSTESKPHNRGFGLDQIRSNVKNLKGKLLIISGSVIYLSSPDGKTNTVTNSENFPGTLIVVYLDSTKLPTKEFDESEEVSLF